MSRGSAPSRDPTTPKAGPTQSERPVTFQDGEEQDYSPGMLASPDRETPLPSKSPSANRFGFMHGALGAPSPRARSGTSLRSKVSTGTPKSAAAGSLSWGKVRAQSKMELSKTDASVSDEMRRAFNDRKKQYQTELLEDLEMHKQSKSKASKITGIKGDRTLEGIFKYVAEQRRDMKYYATDEAVEEECRFGCYVDMKEYHMLRAELREQRVIKVWFFFDLFFGLLILVNGIFLGLTTDGSLNEDTEWLSIWEKCTWCMFMSEFLIRLRAQKNKVQALRNDPWLIIDSFSLVSSLADLVVSSVAGSRSGASLVTVLRIIRLLRLIRLIRVLRFFQDLWILVTGLYNAHASIIWAICLSILGAYMFGVLLLAFTAASTADMSEDAALHWGSLLKGILTMLQISTFDGGRAMRLFMAEVGNPTALLLFVAYQGVTSFGILNLVIGVLLTSSFIMAKKDEGYKGMVERLKVHHAIRDLRRILTRYCRDNQDFDSVDGKPVLSKQKMLYLRTDQQMLPRGVLLEQMGDGDEEGAAEMAILEELEHLQNSRRVHGSKHSYGSEQSAMSADIKDALEVAQAGKEEKESMAKAKKDAKAAQALEDELEELGIHDLNRVCFLDFFASAGVTEGDVNEIYGEMASVTGEDRPLSVDDFIEACIWLKGDVHPLDLCSLMTGLQSMHRRISRQLSALDLASKEVKQASSRLQPLIKDLKAQLGETVEHQHQQTRVHHAKDAAGSSMNRRETQLVVKAQEANYKSRKWRNFDAFFSTVVMANAVIIGLEATYNIRTLLVRDISSSQVDGPSILYFLLEIFFFAVYVGEAGLRVVFSYQMEVAKDFRTWAFVLPKSIWTLNCSTFISLCTYAPRVFYHDPVFVFDLLIVLLGGVDNFILRFIRGDEAYTEWIRIIGLLRLLRLGRLIYLLRPLRMLARGFIMSTRLIFWAFVLLLCPMYALSLAVVSTIGQDPNDADALNHWGHVGDAIISLASMATFSNWARFMDEIGMYYPWAYALGLAYVSFLSLGVLNLVTGVMVQAAFSLVKKEASFASASQLGMLRQDFLGALDKAQRDTSLIARREMNRADAIVRKLTEYITHVTYSKAEKHQVGKRFKRKQSMGMAMGKRPSAANVKASEEDEDYAPREEEEEYKETSEHPRCRYDERNICTVKVSYWLSQTEVVISFVSIEDKSWEPMRKPEHSCLAWEGGQRLAEHFLPEVVKDEGEDGDATFGGTASADPFAEGTDSKSRPGARGILVFGKMIPGKRLKFRFGGNYEWVNIVPNGSDLQQRLAGNWPDSVTDRFDVRSGLFTGLEDVRHRQHDFIDFHQLQQLLQDTRLTNSLARVGLRPEHVLVVYGQLNIAEERRLRVSDLIEGVLRLKQQHMGIDVARSKSVMRRLITEMAHLQLVLDASMSCFSQVVEALHELDLLPQEEVARKPVIRKANTKDSKGSKDRNLGTHRSMIQEAPRPTPAAPVRQRSQESVAPPAPSGSEPGPAADGGGTGDVDVGDVQLGLREPRLSQRFVPPPIDTEQISNASPPGDPSASATLAQQGQGGSSRDLSQKAVGYPTEMGLEVEQDEPKIVSGSMRVGKAEVDVANEKLRKRIEAMREHVSRRLQRMGLAEAPPMCRQRDDSDGDIEDSVSICSAEYAFE